MKISRHIFIFVLLITASNVYAQDPTWLNSINTGGVTVLTGLITLSIAIALLVFIFGIVKFISHSGDEKATEAGKQLMIWGIIGLFVIVSVWGLVAILRELVGAQNPATPFQAPQTGEEFIL